jgi:large subunit ribosomal protein L29
MSSANELRELKIEELRGRVTELEQQLFEMRTKHNTGVLDSTAELGETRRQIARCLTVARQKEIGVDKPAKITKAPKAEAEKKPAKKAGKAKE